MFAPPISKQEGASVASTSPSGELCAGGDGGTTLFRSVSCDEDGGKPASIAASGSEQSDRARLREQLKKLPATTRCPRPC
jgi:hypothetical protein